MHGLGALKPRALQKNETLWRTHCSKHMVKLFAFFMETRLYVLQRIPTLGVLKTAEVHPPIATVLGLRVLSGF